MNLRKLLNFLAKVSFLFLPLGLSSQIDSTSTGTSRCQGDTITVRFDVGAQPFNPGNEFRIELSDNTGSFANPDSIEINPLLNFNPGRYTIRGVLPANLPLGAYSIRVISSNPITNGDTVVIVVGKNPPVDQGINIDGGYYSPIFQDYRFCLGDTVILRSPSPDPGESYDYQWLLNGAPIPDIAGGTEDTLLVTESGFYALELSLGSCDAVTKDTLINAYRPPSFVSALPQAGFIIRVDTAQFCIGDTITLTGPTPPDPAIVYDYLWHTDSITALGDTIIYPLLNDTLQTIRVDSTKRVYLVVNDDFCTDTSAAFNVFVDTIPESPISIIPLPDYATSPDICPYDSLMLAAADTMPGWVYRWERFIGGVWDSLGEDPFLQIGEALVSGTSRQFRLWIGYETCQWISDTITVNITPLPQFTFNVPGDTVGICEGDSILIVIQNVSNTIQTRWNGVTGASIWASSEGTYYAEGTSGNGCIVEDSIVVEFFTPTADAGPNQTTFPDSTIQLNGSGGVDFFWYADKPVFFNNQFSANPRTIPSTKPDTITYYLEITGENGCTDIDSMQVFVIPLPVDDNVIYDNVQNFISPNGDGYNDVLNLSDITNNDICAFTVLNRWGKEVYRTETFNNDWAGVDDGGTVLPDGVYFVILGCNDEVRYKGSVTVMSSNQ